MSAIHRIGDETNGELWDRWNRDGLSLSARRAEIKLMRLEIETIEPAARKAHARVAEMFREARIKVLRGLQPLEQTP